MTVESPNKMTSIRHIRKELAIYKTGRSPYWLIRLRNPFEGKYITRSSKETSRVEATDAANEYADSFFRKANGDLARLCCTNPVRDSSFESSVIAGLDKQTKHTDLHDLELARV